MELECWTRLYLVFFIFVLAFDLNGFSMMMTALAVGYDASRHVTLFIGMEILRALGYAVHDTEGHYLNGTCAFHAE